MSEDAILSVKNLSVSFAPKKKLQKDIVMDISFSVIKGE